MKLAGLFEKLVRVKTAVPGNRERFRYEETFGMPQEERFHLTMPTSWQTRILAETEFALRMAEAESDEGTQTEQAGTVEKTLDYLLVEISENGALTDQACRSAEDMLSPLKEAAKTYSLILAAHAHLDMNWMWGWDETVSAVVNTFRTMLRLMDEYPDFRFSQSQAACYKIIEDFAPEMKDAIRARIQEGRWEVTASAWVETDKNMPAQESLLRHIAYTKKYLSEHWGVDPQSLQLDFSPDTFGHSANLPAIDTLGGLRWYYHCRGVDGDDVLYRWRSLSGDELLVYREPYWYNSAITPHIGTGLPDISRRCGGLKTGLIVYGVGDHGGGPTRRDLEKACAMMEWPIFPAIRFGTFREFFTEAESVREHVPVREGELNFIFPGCYTTQSETKKGNKHSERSLRDAEFWSAMASVQAGFPYKEEIFEQAWQKVLFTHFHDILTGSNTADSKQHALGLYQEAMAASETRTNLALEALSSRIDTKSLYDLKRDLFAVPVRNPHDLPQEAFSQAEGAGVGYGLSRYGYAAAPESGRGLGRVFHIFNSASAERHDFAEITVWDWTGDMRRIAVFGPDGSRLNTVLLDQELQTYWDHKYFRILAEVTVSAFGYTTLLLTQDKLESYPVYYQPSVRTTKPFSDIVLENRHLKAVFSSQDGRLLSLTDKAKDTEVLHPGETAGLVYVATERRTSNGWQIGRYLSETTAFTTLELERIGQTGDALQGFSMKQTFRNSVFQVRVTLVGDSKRLNFETEFDWQEVSRQDKPVPVLIFRVPVAAKQFVFDVPAGFVTRPAQGLDVPGLTFGAADLGSRALMLISESKYGYRALDDSLSLTLLNSTYSPDHYPEFGEHQTRFALALTDNNEEALKAESESALLPLRYYSAGIHEGRLPAAGSLLEANLHAFVSGIRAENGRLLLTLFSGSSEVSGQFTLPDGFTGARLTDLDGRDLENSEVQVNGGTASLSLPAGRMVILELSR